MSRELRIFYVHLYKIGEFSNKIEKALEKVRDMSYNDKRKQNLP